MMVPSTTTGLKIGEQSLFAATEHLLASAIGAGLGDGDRAYILDGKDLPAPVEPPINTITGRSRSCNAL